MADLATPKAQQTAYERWELSSLSDADQPIRSAKPLRNDAPIAPDKVAQVYENVRKEAFAKGMQEGFAVGMAKSREYAEVERQSFASLLQNFSDALEKADEQIADDILSLALDIAKSMLKTKMDVDKSVILPVVMEAIHYLPYVQKPARIIVHHDDAPLLREYLAEELSSQNWQIQEDVNIERGGCLVETGANQIDATNEVRWKRITDSFSKNSSWVKS